MNLCAIPTIIMVAQACAQPSPTAPGLNRVLWDLMREESQRLPNADDLPEFVPPGQYTITVLVGDDHSAEVEVEVLPMREPNP